LNIDCSLF